MAEMGYSIRLERGRSRSKIVLPRLGDLPVGSTYMLGDPGHVVRECDLRLNITYNYSWYFGKALGGDGVRRIYGMKGADALPLLERASAKLARMAATEEKSGRPLDPRPVFPEGEMDMAEWSENYWNQCAANAKRAVDGLIALARIAPRFTFNGD